MVLTPGARGFIRRVPGQARSITLTVLPECLPLCNANYQAMPNQTTKPTKKPGGWSKVRSHLATLDKPALLALVKDLYEAAAENRDFIQAHCHGGDPDVETGGEILENYRRKIVEQFFPARGHGKLKLGEARKAIRNYRKATGNVSGTAELLMTYVENGAEFTHEYGDIDERFYSSVESALNELAALLLREAPGMYPQFIERLARVEQLAGDIGWGFGDYVADVVAQLDDELGDQ